MVQNAGIDLKKDKTKGVKGKKWRIFTDFMTNNFARTEWKLEQHCKIKIIILSFWVDGVVSWWVDEFASLQVCRFASLQVCEFASLWVCEFVSWQVCEFVSLWVCELMSCKFASLWVLEFLSSWVCKLMHSGVVGFREFMPVSWLLLINAEWKSFLAIRVLTH